MRRIKLMKLFLKNFKGLKELSVTFNDVTDILGGNGTGKTTLHDAFTWLLFDKDSMDRQSFEIKPLDSDNKVFHELEHEVTGILDVDGEEITLTKILKEKWTKKKGEVDREFGGHETLYFINEVPIKQTEYKETISKFITKQQFKLICNPMHFSAGMKWEDRRKLVIDIVGDIPKEKVFSCKEELLSLKELLAETDIDDFRKSVNARKKKLNVELEAIPEIIAELNSFLHEYDYDHLKSEKEKYEFSLNELMDKLFNRAAANDGLLEDMSRLHQLKEKLRDIEYSTEIRVEDERRILEGNILEAVGELEKLDKSIEDAVIEREKISKNLAELQPMLETLKSQWDELFDREYIKDFDFDRADNLKKVNEEAVDIRTKINQCTLELQGLDTRIGTLEEKRSVIEKEKAAAEKAVNSLVPSIILESNDEYMEIKNQILELEMRLVQDNEKSEDIEELKNDISELTEKLNQCREKLYAREYNESIKGRVKELQAEEKSLEEQIAEEEKKEMLCDEFMKVKAELAEPSIESKFGPVKFKLLNTLVNGTVESCCEVLIDGVPFSNANKAAQINTGLFIIGLLSEHFGVQAPIFIDNRESINEIPACECQIINLIVSKDEKLVVNGLDDEHKDFIREAAAQEAVHIDGEICL